MAAIRSVQRLRSQNRRDPLKKLHKIALCLAVLTGVFAVRRFWWQNSGSRRKLTAAEKRMITLFHSVLDGESTRNEISFAFPATTLPTRQDITLVNHASVNKLQILLHQIQQWRGPVSCALYLTKQDQLLELSDFLARNREALRRTSLHAYLETEVQDYPMNILRNLALNHIDSDYFFAVDVDFWIDETAYTELSAALVKEPSFVQGLHSRTVYVVPAFERFMPSQLTNGVGPNVISYQMMPKNRKELMPMIQTKKAAPFHQNFTRGHGSTNYSNWYRPSSEFSYPIEYEHKYEPYVIAYRYGIPRYWPHFRGFGYNKATWFSELHYMGFQFEVIRNHFVIHKNHVGGGFDRRASQQTIAEWLSFKRYLIETYGASKDVLRDHLDRYGSEEWRKFMEID